MKDQHPQLPGLKALFSLPEKTLNKILWVNTPSFSEDYALAIGIAAQYIEFMLNYHDSDNPADVWEDWCIQNFIEHEIHNNPYL